MKSPRICKQFFAIFLVLRCILTQTVSCGEVPDRTEEEAQVLRAAQDMLTRAVLVDTVFYGEGIPPSEEEGAFREEPYVEADPAYLAEHGLTDTASLRALVRSVYSTSHSESLFQMALSPIYSDSQLISAVRYTDMSPAEGEPPRLMVRVKLSTEPLMPDTVIPHPDTLRVVGVRGERVTVSFEATVKRAADGATQTRTVDVPMLEEAGGWRFDALVSVRYRA